MGGGGEEGGFRVDVCFVIECWGVSVGVYEWVCGCITLTLCVVIVGGGGWDKCT